MLQERISFITNYLVTHCLSIEVADRSLSALAWEIDTFETRFGYALPQRREDDEWEIRFCAEIIAAQTLPLSEEELTQYLDAILWTLDMHITHNHLDEDERRLHVENTLASIAPGSLAMMNDVQVRAIDTQE